MTLKPLVLAGVLLATLSGCIPAPHRVPLVPALSGVVTRAGQPVAGAGIVASYGLAERHEVDFGVTDAQGRFAGPGKQELHMVRTIGDPVFDWQLRIRAPGGEVSGYRQRGMGTPPARAELDCDLDRAVGSVCDLRSSTP